MHKDAGKLIVHAHLFTMKGDGVGYVADGAVAVQGRRPARGCRPCAPRHGTPGSYGSRTALIPGNTKGFGV